MMSDSVKKNLRQTTLKFGSKSPNKQTKKRKMAENNSGQQEKKLKPDCEGVADDSKPTTDGETSKYFKEDEEKKVQDTRTPDQIERSKQAAAAAERRQGTGSPENRETKPETSTSSDKAEEEMDTRSSKSPSPCKGALKAQKMTDGGEGTSVDDEDRYNATMEYEMNSSQEPNGSETTDDSQGGVETDIPTTKPSRLQRESSWRGTRLKELQATPECLGEVLPLKDQKNHTILIRLPYTYDVKDVHPPPQHPISFMDKWDADHVRMPCSPSNEYPVETKGRKPQLRRRWELIEEALQQDIQGPYELEAAILKYNQRYQSKWNFSVLNNYFTKYIRKEERNKFFSDLLPKMVKLALKLPHLVTQPIPLLKQHMKHKITLSQQQVACLLANAFFCTFPRRNTRQRNTEYANYPDINFNNMFQGNPSSRKLEKLKCIIHYFSRVTSEMPVGAVTFERKVIDIFPKWEELGTDFCRLHVSSAGTIEDDGKGMLQADFANKFIGGGVLGHGCVQEEIRFLICPEMIITRLFTEVLDRNESLLMSGCEQFSQYDGYTDTFTWNGDFNDTTPRDINGHRHVDVIAIDALVIRDFKKQFQKWCVTRELNKAYVGFYDKHPKHQLSAVCTGNWGCGAFGGDKRLKALIQLMAASAAKRDVCYFTFDDNQLTDDLYKFHHFISRENGLSVGNIMTLIDQYNRNVCQKLYWGKPKKNLFEYIVAAFEGNLDSDTTNDGFSEGSHEGGLEEEEKMDAGSEKGKSLKRQDSEDYKATTP